MKKSFLILILFLISFELKAQMIIMSKESDSLVKRGADFIYNIQFDEATKCFNKVIVNEPKNPAGYFLQCMVDWWKISLYRYTQQLDQGFLDKIDIVLNLCNQKLNNIDMQDITTKDDQVSALFFKGAALGYRARFYTQRENYFKAASDGQEAFKIMQKCHELAPGNHDIMLGTGIYNYFAEAIPEQMPVLKPVMAFFPSGNKKLGILQLRASSLYARYTSIEAKVALMQVFYSFENNANEALYYSKMLFEAYPRNPYFHRYFARCWVRYGNWDSIEYHWRNVVNKCLNRDIGYDNLTAQEGCYYVGLALERKRDYPTALKYLLKCDQIAKYIEKEPSSWQTSSNLKIGVIYDKTGDRKKAMEYYNNVLKLKDFQDCHELAKRYLKEPARY